MHPLSIGLIPLKKIKLHIVISSYKFSKNGYTLIDVKSNFMRKQMYSTYYQAYVEKKECWFLTAILRSFEHLVFDRTVNKEKSIFEFFVTPGCERYFEEILDYLKHEKVIISYEKLPNRLCDPLAEV